MRDEQLRAASPPQLEDLRSRFADNAQLDAGVLGLITGHELINDAAVDQRGAGGHDHPARVGAGAERQHRDQPCDCHPLH